MSNLYDRLKNQYALSDKYQTLSPELEAKIIKEYNNPNTSKERKSQIIELFWDMNKSRIVKHAIKIYNNLYKMYCGDMQIEIEELIQKGFFAIPHCLSIFGKKPKKKSTETPEQYKNRCAQRKTTRFGTLLDWWIRPFIQDHIHHENNLIYVPHSKSTEVKSVKMSSLDSAKYDNSERTNLDFIPDENQDPAVETRKTLFWEQVKSLLTEEEYDFLFKWLFIDEYFEYKKEFYDYFKITPPKAKQKLENIYKKLRPSMKEWKD